MKPVANSLTPKQRLINILYVMNRQKGVML
nr:MAG TPA: hypothetical protein [Caudoviricetes sp.]